MTEEQLRKMLEELIALSLEYRTFLRQQNDTLQATIDTLKDAQRENDKLASEARYKRPPWWHIYG
jgi:uncharacterized coiled-coil protein SlyX